MPLSNNLPAVRLRTWRLGTLSAGPIAMEPTCRLCGIQAAGPEAFLQSLQPQAASCQESFFLASPCKLHKRAPKARFLGYGFYLAPPWDTFRCAIAWRACEAAGPTVPAFVLCGLCAILKTGRCAGQLSYLDLQLRHLHDMDPAGHASAKPCSQDSDCVEVAYCALSLVETYGFPGPGMRINLYACARGRSFYPRSPCKL